MSFPRLITNACLIGTLLAGCIATPEGSERLVGVF
jgi:hypothetical protein